MKTPARFVAAAALALVPLLALHVAPWEPVASYTFLLLLASAGYLWFASEALRAEVPDRTVILAVAAALVVRATFLAADPIGSDDAYRYLWDGKVQAAGIDPYRFPPDAPELAHLRSPLLPASINHPDMRTLYFPLSQWLFYASYRLSGEALWGFKLLLLAAELATILALWLLTARLSLPRRCVLLYALCPLPVASFAIDAHLDGLGLPLLTFALLAFLPAGRSAARPADPPRPIRPPDGGRTATLVLSLALLGLSISIKPVGLVLLPALLLAVRGWRRRLLVGIVPAAVVAVQFLPYLPGPHTFDSLAAYAENWTFNGAVFEVVYLTLRNNQVSRLVCALLLAVALVLLYRRQRQLPDRVYYSVLLLLLFSPVVHPWYVAWLTVLLPLARRWSGIFYSSAASLAVLTVLAYRRTGVWEQSGWVLALEYLPVIWLAARELGAAKTGAGQGGEISQARTADS